MRITSTGNVGIGTTTPGELLNLYGTADCFAKIDASGGSGQAGLRLFAGNGASSHRASRIDFFNIITSTSTPRWTLISDTIQNGTNDFRVVNGAGASVFTILQSGNIGIGTRTASPLKLLHLVGSNPTLTIEAQGGQGATSQLDLATYDITGRSASCSLIATDNGTGGNTFQVNLKINGDVNYAQFTPFSISPIGIITTTSNIDCGGGIAINGSMGFFWDFLILAVLMLETYQILI